MAVDFDFHATCSNCGATDVLCWGTDQFRSWDDIVKGRKPYPRWSCKFCLGGHNQKKINYHLPVGASGETSRILDSRSRKP